MTFLGGRALLLGLAALMLIVGAFPATASHGGGGTPVDRTEFCPLDTMLVLDESGSMNSGPGSAYDMMQQGAVAYLDELDDIEDQSGVISFSGSGTNTASYRLRQPLEFDHPASKNAVNQNTAGGNTWPAFSIKAAHDQFLQNGRSDARWVMVFLSDGQASDGPAAIANANAAKADGVEIFSIAVQGSSPAFMRDIASDPASVYVKEALTPPQIYTAFEQVIDELPKVCVNADVTPVWCHDEGEVITTITDLTARTPGKPDRVEVDWGDGRTRTVPASTIAAIPHNVGHSYADPGTYTITVTAFDDRGNEDSVEREIYLSGCPTADFECTTHGHPRYLDISFVDTSMDPDGNVIAWQWDFGDGKTGSGSSLSHGFPAKGMQAITLNVTDDDNNTAEVTKECFADLNLPPVMDPIPVQVVYEGQKLEFKVGATDPEDDELWYSWNRGDVRREAEWSAATQEFQWRTTKGDAGHYSARFQARDWEFPSEPAKASIIVLPVPPLPEPETWDADGDGVPDPHDACPFLAGDCDGITFEGPALTGPPSAEGDLPPEDIQTAPQDLDSDGDGTTDVLDNCPFVPNRRQVDTDADGQGNACDPDLDGDRIPNVDASGRLLDNCPYAANLDQLDADHDGFGDACDGDVDSDGVANAQDNCPWLPNPLQEDADGDGIGDACGTREAEHLPFDDLETPHGSGAATDGTSEAADSRSAPAIPLVLLVVPLVLLIMALTVLALRRRR